MVQALEWPSLFQQRNAHVQRKPAHLPVEEFDPGDALSIAGVHIQTYSTSHDVVNPVGYRFDAQGDSIGFATDTGELSKHAIDTLKDCRILALESNYDVTMLRQGDYPRFLQERILSVKGISPTIRPPMPHARWQPIAPSNLSRCTLAKTTIAQA